MKEISYSDTYVIYNDILETRGMNMHDTNGDSEIGVWGIKKR